MDGCVQDRIEGAKRNSTALHLADRGWSWEHGISEISVFTTSTRRSGAPGAMVFPSPSTGIRWVTAPRVASGLVQFSVQIGDKSGARRGVFTICFLIAKVVVEH